MRIIDCMVNHIKNPIGYTFEHITFSYLVEGATGSRQTEARICVFSGASGSNLIYDSGFRDDIKSTGYTVELKTAPRTAYYWHVTVRTDVGEEQTSGMNCFETGKQDEPWQAKWITCPAQEENTSIFKKLLGSTQEEQTGERHPKFSKSLALNGNVESARMYICGLGLYEAYINRERVGEERMTPYCNDYHSWLQYQTYDVTQHLKKGAEISVLLGNGWYKGLYGLTARRTRESFYSNTWKLIAEIHVRYSDGHSEVFGTDESWKVTRSSIISSDIYDGEEVDETLVQTKPVAAVLCTEEMAPLYARYSTPVMIREELPAKEIIHTPAGETVVDIGQNIAGVFRLSVNVPKGQLVHLQFGETLQEGNFYRGNLRMAKAEYKWISDGTPHVLCPHFTFYGYRYVKIEGVSNLRLEDFTGLAMYSQIQSISSLMTGNKLINQFLSNVRWGQKDNFLDVPTDCPQRDERLGWTGDAQVFCNTANYFTDCYAFYRKYLKDMWQEQQRAGGMVPDYVPAVGKVNCSCAWGDAACIIPWTMYLHTGDSSILAEQYESMKAWVEYIRKIDGNDCGWRRHHHYGDWLALDHPLHLPEQTRGATDEAYIADVYYRNSVLILAKTAAILDRNADEQEYTALSKTLLGRIRDEFFSRNERCCIDTQTGYLLALQHSLADPARQKQALVKSIKDVDGQLRTGFVGTPLLCNVLSQVGESKMAYDLLMNEEYPGWLYEVKMGATTVWERWNSIEPDGKISSTGMNSLNHYAYGSVADWLWGHAVGLRPVESAPGFTKAIIAPEPDWRLRTADAKIKTAAGTYSVKWELVDAQHIHIMISVPFDCSAELRLPFAPSDVYADKTNPLFANVQNEICFISAGSYEVSYETTCLLRKVCSLDTPIRELLASEKCRDILAPMEAMFSQIPNEMKGMSVNELMSKYGGAGMSPMLSSLDSKLREVE